MPYTTAILLAGGSGTRMDGSVADKVLHSIHGKPVWRHSYEAFQASGSIQHYVFVCRDEVQKSTISNGLIGRDDRSTLSSVEGPGRPNAIFVTGGTERQDSVWNGLQTAPEETEIVLIHDLARPLITPEAIRKVAQAAHQHGAATLARPVTDTIKRTTPKADAHVLQTVDRSKLWSMETPQAFRFSLIKAAYQKVIESGLSITDDLSALESEDHAVAFIRNSRPNVKITTEQDLHYVSFLLQTTD